MMTRPTAPEILNAIREELRTIVAPAVHDLQATMTLGLIETLIGLVATRIDHESLMMASEIRAVEALTRGSEDNQRLDSGEDRSNSTENLTRRYYEASQELSRLLEDATHHAHDEALDLLAKRLQDELVIAGSLTLIGRAGMEK